MAGSEAECPWLGAAAGAASEAAPVGVGAEAEHREPDAADVEAKPAVELAVAEHPHTKHRLVVAT